MTDKESTTISGAFMVSFLINLRKLNRSDGKNNFLQLVKRLELITD